MLTDPSFRSVKRTKYNQPLNQFRLIQGIECQHQAKSSPLPKCSLIIRDWTNGYMGDSIETEVFENLKSKHAPRMGLILNIR